MLKKTITVNAPPEYYKEFIWHIFREMEEKGDLATLDRLMPDELLEAFIEKMYEKGWRITRRVQKKEVRSADKKV